MYSEGQKSLNAITASGGSGAGIEKETAFSKVFRTGNMVSELVERLESLADSLTGSIPEAGNSEKNPPSRCGLFGALEDSTEAAQRRVLDGFQAIERIRSVLP